MNLKEEFNNSIEQYRTIYKKNYPAQKSWIIRQTTIKKIKDLGIIHSSDYIEFILKHSEEFGAEIEEIISNKELISSLKPLGFDPLDTLIYSIRQIADFDPVDENFANKKIESIVRSIGLIIENKVVKRLTGKKRFNSLCLNLWCASSIGLLVDLYVILCPRIKFNMMVNEDGWDVLALSKFMDSIRYVRGQLNDNDKAKLSTFLEHMITKSDLSSDALIYELNYAFSSDDIVECILNAYSKCQVNLGNNRSKALDNLKKLSALLNTKKSIVGSFIKNDKFLSKEPIVDYFFDKIDYDRFKSCPLKQQEIIMTVAKIKFEYDVIIGLSISNEDTLKHLLNCVCKIYSPSRLNSYSFRQLRKVSLIISPVVQSLFEQVVVDARSNKISNYAARILEEKYTGDVKKLLDHRAENLKRINNTTRTFLSEIKAAFEQLKSIGIFAVDIGGSGWAPNDHGDEVVYEQYDNSVENGEWDENNRSACWTDTGYYISELTLGGQQNDALKSAMIYYCTLHDESYSDAFYEKNGKAIANKIVACFKSRGLYVSWDGKTNSAIYVELNI